MKKISSAIFLLAFIVFIGCKNNAEQASEEDKKDSASIFYQSIVKLGNGFIDVFNAFGGLVADTFFKTDPKKSDVKTYFDSITKTLKDTKDNLEKLSNEKTSGDGDEKATAGTAKHEGKKGNEAENAIQAAIGGGNQQGEDFNDRKMGKKNDQIAAALVLRGMA
ncbi:variable large family protein, partial [Borreliella garinii]|uniref:variable large family protein n=1 Tax=Borreliella garinii TaxID=29519 RepID=UPI001AEF7370